MRRNMSGNLGLYKYLWPGSVCLDRHNSVNKLNSGSKANYSFLLSYLGYGFKEKTQSCHSCSSSQLLMKKCGG